MLQLVPHPHNLVLPCPALQPMQPMRPSMRGAGGWCGRPAMMGGLRAACSVGGPCLQEAKAAGRPRHCWQLAWHGQGGKGSRRCKMFCVKCKIWQDARRHEREHACGPPGVTCMWATRSPVHVGHPESHACGPPRVPCMWATRSHVHVGHPESRVTCMWATRSPGFGCGWEVPIGRPLECSGLTSSLNALITKIQN